MMWKLISSFLLLYFQNNFCSCGRDLPEVDTALGKIRGFWKTTVNGRKYAAFEGIPFAKPPVGNLRFEEPQPASAWSGTWEAKEGPICMQAELITDSPIKKLFGQEDCLYLNVYVPAEFLHEPNNLNVMVLIQGGAFMVDNIHIISNSKVMMDRDIVLVTLNYRLGILGFLSTEDDAIPGNNGLKDQVLALKWVKNNIASFRGDPNSITLVGLSAGGASVHLHYFSPLSKGLFVRGMSQSGTALAPWVIRKNALQKAKKLAILVGCPESPTKDLKTCLKQIPVEKLLQQLKHFFGFESMLPLSPFAPVVEKGSKNPFLDKEPFQLLREGNVFDVPWITSTAADDGLIFSGIFLLNLDQVDQNWSHLSKYILDYNDTLPISKQEIVAKQILDFYLGPDEKINWENFKKFTQICTDKMFGMPAEIAAKMQAKVNKSPVYFYFFNYKGERSLMKYFKPSVELKGATHGDDGIYFYGFIYDKPFSERDGQMANACQDMLFSYVSSGKPSFDGTNTWQPTTSNELCYLNVTGPGNFKLIRIKNLTPNAFWSKLRLLENDNNIV